MNYLNKNIIFILFSLFILSSCQNQAELTMERGIQYYEWNKFELAILEFNQVIKMFENKQGLDYEQVRLLSQAHHNLSIAFSKIDDYINAKKHAEKAFDLIPSNDNRAVLELLNQNNY